MTKFTPGPWQLSQGDGEFLISAGDATIAMARGLNKEGDEANAHLIAAAPELYAALLYLVHCPIDDGPRALDRAEAALHKARGET